MNTENDVEIHVEGGAYCGPAKCEFSIQDGSFDHEFGTEEITEVALDEVGCDNLLFFPTSDPNSDGEKMTAAQIEEAEEIILGDPEKYINFPHHYDVAEYHSGY